MKTLYLTKRGLTFVISVFLTLPSVSQVGINPSGNPVDSSAGLDVDFSDKGLLIPRVALLSASDATTIASPATSLLVYNPGTGGLSPAGYYFNAGTSSSPNWIRLATEGESSGWSLSGNGGTDETQHFIGTTDTESFIIKTDDTERIRIDSDGNVGLGLSSPNVSLDINGALATRMSSVHLTTDDEIAVGNNSHILLSTTGNTSETPYLFTLTDGQPGQYLVVELQSGYAKIESGGNVEITSPLALLLSPFSVISLKWDDVNAAWVELSRNSKVVPFLPTNPLNPPSSFNGKQFFFYTGSEQNFVVPTYISQVYVKVWGAGGAGGGNGAGGMGAFVSGYLNVTPGSTLKVLVGGGGKYQSGSGGGYGGGGNAGSGNYGGGGGGRTAIRTELGVELVTAGGGGGGACCGYYGGEGGNPNGANAGGNSATFNGKGGTTSAGGAATTGGAAPSIPGSALIGSAGGSSTNGGGGGGGGYYGGSGGSGNTTTSTGGGGGGSSYTANLTSVTNITGPNNGDVDYIPGTAVGPAHHLVNSGTGGDGGVVIYW